MMRPWKLITLAIGIVILIAGSLYEELPDWDIGVSIVMAVLTYLTAPLFIRTIYARHWKLFPIVFVLAWFSIDGSYWLYNLAVGHPSVREANAIASAPLYLIMGLVWLWDGTLQQLVCSITALRDRQQHPPPRP